MGICEGKNGANSADGAGEDTGHMASTSTVQIVATKTSQRYPVDTGNRGDIPNPATLETDTTRLHGLPKETTLENESSRNARGKMGNYLIVFGEEDGGNQLRDGM
jgi:hypothetical protein